MKELAVVSGKGGTGKTSVVASFAALARPVVAVDCDVDAADLHLVLAPSIERAVPFQGGETAVIRAAACTGCGVCASACRFESIHLMARTGKTCYVVDPLTCEGCGLCAHVCPHQAVDLAPRTSGEWYVSSTRNGPLVHARLGVAQENSGKLATCVRKEGRRIALEHDGALLLIDGPPGIGCPVIASLTGASLALIVTESSFSGLHDLARVAGVAAMLGVRTAVCVNRSDVDPATSRRIRDWCEEARLPHVGDIPYDRAVVDAQLRGRSVVEHSEGAAASAIRHIWERVSALLES